MTDENPYLSLEEVANRFKVSDSTVRKWVRNKNIPEDSYFLIGHTYRFDINKVTDHLFADRSAGGAPASMPSDEEA